MTTAANIARAASSIAVDANNNVTVGGLIVAAFASGTTMIFAQTASPTGWTKSTTHNDKALRVVNGSASSGGSVAFSTAFASQTPSGTISGTVGSTTLSTDQLPSHSHRINVSGADDNNHTGNGDGPADSDAGMKGYLRNTEGTGGGQSHNHSFSGSFSGSAINLAVSYVDVIIATKD